MRVSLVCLRKSTKNLKAKNVIRILHSSFSTGGGTVFQTATLLCFLNPETASRVTLATFGIVFQTKLPTTDNLQPITNNQTPTTKHQQPIIIYFYLLIFYFSTKQQNNNISLLHPADSDSFLRWMASHIVPEEHWFEDNFLVYLRSI